MLDELVDDPVFARVYAARPAAPASLERAVLDRLANRPRWPLLVGCVVAIAAVVCIVLLARGGDGDASKPIAKGPAPDAATPVVVPSIVAPSPWTDLPALWSTLEHEHRAAIEACGSGNVVIRVVRERDGSTRAVHPPGVGRRAPTAAARCRARAVAAIRLPFMPQALVAISFVMAIPAVAQPAHPWIDPIATIRAHCPAGTVVVDRTHRHNPRIRGCSAELAPLPPMLLSVELK